MEQIANRYQLLDELGIGGMGAVYRAYDLLEQSQVALKRVKHYSETSAFDTESAYTQAKVSLLQEFRTLASLRHPKIISVMDYGFDHERIPFFTMPLLEEAQSIVEFSYNCTQSEKTALLIQTLQALVYLHRRDILHRDLKPANVLVRAIDDVKVLDFGLSANTTYATGASGTLSYMAPEVLRDHSNSRLADLYAVGMIAYEIFVGRYPFKLTHTVYLIKQIIEVMPDTSMLENQRLATVLNRWLLKDPDDRYQSASDIIIALCEAVDLDPPIESVAIRESFLQASTFIGRDHELDTLQHSLKRVINGQNAFYLVGGESGIGKSRLLEELRIAALVAGAMVLQGRSVKSGLPYQLWRNIVRRLLLQVDIDDTQASILKEIVPDIATLLNRDVADRLLHSGDDRNRQLVATILDVIKRAQKPLVILLEDLQWAEASLAPLIHLMESPLQMSHVMIVGNYRNDESPDLPEVLSGFETITLDRLNKESIQSLSQSMLGSRGANEQVVRLLQRETEGNLFFLVETVRALAESSGGLQNIGNTTLPDSVFTGGMRHIAQHRLSKVKDIYHDIQELAAIFGREIDIQLLASLFPQQHIEDWLTHATDVAVLIVQANQWLFAHDKFREAILTAIPADNKHALYQTAAQAIETVYPEDEDYYLSLMQYWRIAGDLTREAFYLDRVASRLIQFEANYEDASALLNNFLERCPTDDLLRNRFLNLSGELNRRRHHLDIALDFSQQVLSNDPTPVETVQALETIAAVHYFRGELPKATETWQKMVKLSQPLPDQIHHIVGLNNLGFVSFHQADYVAAKAYLTQSIVISRQIPDMDVLTLTNALQNLAFVSLKLEDYDISREYFLEALDYAYTARIIPLLLTTLTGLTHLEALFNSVHRATQWAGLVHDHVALRPETRTTKLDPLITHLRTQLSPEEFETAFAQGKTLDMMDVVQSILDNGGDGLDGKQM